MASGGPYGIDASAHLLLERALSAAQIDLICDRCARLCGAQANAPIGGSVSGYLQRYALLATWQPRLRPNVSSADLNIYTLPSRGPVVRFCR